MLLHLYLRQYRMNLLHQPIMFQDPFPRLQRHLNILPPHLHPLFRDSSKPFIDLKIRFVHSDLPVLGSKLIYRSLDKPVFSMVGCEAFILSIDFEIVDAYGERFSCRASGE